MMTTPKLKTVSTEKDNSKNPDGQRPFWDGPPLEIGGQIPLQTLNLETREVPALVDTGASLSIVSHSFVKVLGA